MKVFALILNLYLLNGEPAPLVIDIYTTLEQCQEEAVHQIIGGIPGDALSCQVEGIDE